MKKFLLIYFQLCIISLFSQEQSFQIGIKTGAGISKMFIEKAAQDNLNPKISYALMNGLSFNYKTKDIFQVQADLLFTRKGYSRVGDVFLEDSTRVSFNNTTGLDYFEISIIPGVQTKGNTSFKMNIGPYLGFFYNRNFTFKKEGSKLEVTDLAPKGLNINKKIDFGAVIELSINQRINDKLFIELGTRSEMSIYNQAPFFQYKSPKFFTSNVFVGLNYRFGL